MTTPEAPEAITMLQGELNAALARLSEALSQKASLEAALIENHRLASEQINEKHRILTETRGALAAANARADAIELARVVLLADERREKHRADAAEEALAAARRECEALREAMIRVRDRSNHGDFYEAMKIADAVLASPSSGAEERIAELERVIELAYPFVAEGDENMTVDGLTQEQIVRHINKVMRAALAAPASAAGEEGKR